MSTWKLISNFAIPPALFLTVLLVIPTPPVIRRGLLNFTRNVLFFNVLGGLKLVHVIIALTGIAFTGCSVNTYHMTEAMHDEHLTPNQKMAMMAKKWREERNFWISALALCLWALLYRFYGLLMEHTAVREENKRLQMSYTRLKQEVSHQQGVAAPYSATPTAPPAGPETDIGKTGVARRKVA